MEQGWEMGAEVHVQDKKLVDKERVWAKGRVVGVEGARALPLLCALFLVNAPTPAGSASLTPVDGRRSPAPADETRDRRVIHVLHLVR